MNSLGIVNWISQAWPEIGWVILAAAALYLLPGLALLQLFWREVPLQWPERLALAFGVGVALPPLLLEIAYWLHLPWQTWAVLAYLLIALLILAVSFFRNRKRRLPWQLELSPSALLFAWLAGLVLVLRLYAVRDLPVGLWGDSYHHTMMAQLLVDNHGLFSSWEPYAPLATFTYHFGFHANVALFHWLTGIPVTKSVLYVGQILNAGTVPLAFALTVALTRDRAAGLWAALITGFLNSQPAFYVNWGRYTQLAGQVILPVVLLSWMQAFDQEFRWKWAHLVFAALTTAGLALTHYIVAIFAALFVLAYLLVLWLRRPSWQTLKWIGLAGSISAGLSLVLIAPWLLNTLNGYLSRNTSAFIAGAVSADRVAGYSMLSSPVPFYINGPILALASLGLLVALAKRDWNVVLFFVWSELMVLASVPQVLGLPGAGIVEVFTSYIALYITVIPLAAFAIGAVQAVLERWQPQFVRWASVGLIGLLSLWGATLNLGRVDTQYQLLTPADARAMGWIQAQTLPEARFLVNSFPAYGGTLVAGTDGGWWIPLLTGRQTSLPPLTYGTERGSSEDLYLQVNQLAVRLRGRPLTDSTPIAINLTKPLAIQALRDTHTEYIYSGAHQTPGSGLADHIDTQVLQNSPFFREVYSSDGVEIFQLLDGD